MKHTNLKFLLAFSLFFIIGSGFARSTDNTPKTITINNLNGYSVFLQPTIDMEECDIVLYVQSVPARGSAQIQINKNCKPEFTYLVEPSYQEIPDDYINFKDFNITIKEMPLP